MPLLSHNTPHFMPRVLAFFALTLLCSPLANAGTFASTQNEFDGEQCPQIRKQGAQKQWVACKKDSDCIVAKGICGGQIGLNKKFKRQNDIYNRCTGPTINCIAPSDMDHSAVSANCINNACKTVAKSR